MAGREELTGERRRGDCPDLVAERCGGDEAGLGRALRGADPALLDAGAMGVPVAVMLVGAGGFLSDDDLEAALGPGPGAGVGYAGDDGKDEYEERSGGEASMGSSIHMAPAAEARPRPRLV